MSNAPTTTLSFETLGGRQDARYVAPLAETRAIIGIIPALGIRADYYSAFQEALAAQGFASVTADLIGAGSSPVRADRQTHWVYKDLVERYAQGLFEATRRHEATAPFYWLGHSLGGQVGMMHAGLAQGQVAGVILFASGSPYHVGWPGLDGLKIRLIAQLFHGLCLLLGYLPGPQLGFGGRESGEFMRAWGHAVETGSFNWRGFEGDALLAQFHGEVLAVNISDDELAPPSSTRQLLSKTNALRSTMKLWEATPSQPVGHNRWPRADPERAVSYISAWLGR